MQVADDGVDLYDDVLGDVGFYRSAIDHLSEVDALLFCHLHESLCYALHGFLLVLFEGLSEHLRRFAEA